MKKHLLLIDDDQHMIRLFSKTFISTDAAFRCTLASSIDHALQMMDFIAVDIIFIKLDPMVGPALSFLSALKRNKKFRHIYLVAFARHIEYYTAVCRGSGIDLQIEPPEESEDIQCSLHLFHLHADPANIFLPAKM